MGVTVSFGLPNSGFAAVVEMSEKWNGTLWRDLETGRGNVSNADHAVSERQARSSLGNHSKIHLVGLEAIWVLAFFSIDETHDCGPWQIFESE